MALLPPQNVLVSDATPNGNVTAVVGQLCVYRVSTTVAELWQKTSQSVAGTLDNTGWTQLGGAAAFAQITPAALAAGTTQDYAPAGIATANRLRQAANVAGSALGGIDSTGIADGMLITVTNLGSGILTFNEQDAGSSAGNQFFNEGGVPRALAVNGSCLLQLDTTLGGFVVIG